MAGKKKNKAAKSEAATEFSVESFLSALGNVFAVHGLVNPSLNTKAVDTDDEDAEVDEAQVKKSGKKAKGSVKKKQARWEDLTAQSGSKKGLKGLMAQAIEAGYDEDEFADADPEDFVNALMTEDFGEDWSDGLDIEASEEDEEAEEEADEEEEEEDGEESEDDETRTEYEAMTLKALKDKALADEDEDGYGYTAADIKGLKKADLIDLMLGYTEESLGERSLGELKKIAKDDFELKVKAGTKKDDLVMQILEAQEEADGDEDDEEDEEEEEDEDE